MSRFSIKKSFVSEREMREFRETVFIFFPLFPLFPQEKNIFFRVKR
jgi:hypothetical protein